MTLQERPPPAEEAPLDRMVDLAPGDLTHLHTLRAVWGLLADLCFADLLLYVPQRPPERKKARADDSNGEGARDGEGDGAPGAFVTFGQVRPATSQTLYPQDLVGDIVPAAEMPIATQSYVSGRIIQGRRDHGELPEPVLLTSVPVRRRPLGATAPGSVLAVLAVVSASDVGRRRGKLEDAYGALADQLTAMVADGTFPFDAGEAAIEEAPRVGDGVLVLDENQRISYASPNAMSALHRIGVHENVVDRRFGDVGVHEAAVTRAFSNRFPVIEEVERRGDVIVLLHCIPLLRSDRVSGAMVVLRDVTELRRRDLLLLSKDAAIREVHHRVKNNLQTISSLLRLQTRRVAPGVGRAALREAERRIRSIAAVHEILSRDSEDQVPFGEIVRVLVQLAREAALPEPPVELTVAGDAGEVTAELATPLSVAIAELLQNAMEHAFDAGVAGNATDEPAVEAERARAARGRMADPCRVELVMSRVDDRLIVEVRDNGKGLPDGFSIDETESLGLLLVRDLVRTQLGGDLSITSHTGSPGTPAGTVARIEVPAASSLARPPTGL